jgi:hypothetical protein
MTSEGAEPKAQQPSKPDLERSYDVHLARLESERKHQNDVFGCWVSTAFCLPLSVLLGRMRRP